MIGDSYKKDVLGARQVGMRAVWLDNPGSFPRQCCGQSGGKEPLECDARIERIKELEDALGMLAAGGAGGAGELLSGAEG
mmetsp:Transcript_48783/g.98348  ORF Transcript_48783/g.98348 Transcript_48783/m.98348 type:complete len:80 (+) Transcript_48783:535-774(+)